MAKEKLSLEEQVRQASSGWMDCKARKDSKSTRLHEAQKAYEAIAEIYRRPKNELPHEAQQAYKAILKIYRRSIKEWAKAQRQCVKEAGRLDRLRQQLSAANQADHAAGGKSGQSRQHGNSGE